MEWVKGTENGFIVHYENGSRLEIEPDAIRGYLADGTLLWELTSDGEGRLDLIKDECYEIFGNIWRVKSEN